MINNQKVHHLIIIGVITNDPIMCLLLMQVGCANSIEVKILQFDYAVLSPVNLVFLNV